MKRVFAIIAIVVFLSACAKEVVEPGMKISGVYALDDQSGLSDRYIAFENGKFLEVQTTRSLTFAENSFWGYNKRLEKKSPQVDYSIIGGRLYVSEQDKGAIEIKDDLLNFQGKKYSKVKSFNETLYSSLTLPGGTEKTTTYDEHEVSVPVTINHPIPAGVLNATSYTNWISNIRVQDGQIIFNVCETNVDRNGSITIQYTNANDISLSVLQRPSTFIKLGENEQTVAYVQSSQSLSYTIKNPLPGSTLNVSCTVDWVKNIVVGAESVTFDVDEHPGATPRTATLAFSYTGAADASFKLTQSAAVTTIVPSPASQSCAYSGGAFSFDFTVDNPRQGISVTAASQNDWITDVAIEGNTVSYKVAENNSGSSRTGRIRLAYGYYATKYFAVDQAWSSSEINLTPASQDTDYAGGSFSFTYAITNPREGATVTATSQNDWITDVVISGNTVSYKVTENNSGAHRVGKVRLSYGDYATKDFTVNQSWSSSGITLTPASQDTDYTSGSFSFTYAITNPREGVSVTAASQSEWITDVVVSGNTVSCKVAENNSGIARVGTIHLTYGSYASKDFTVNQVLKPVQSLSLNKNDLDLLVGNSETLVATVNPTDAQLQWSSNNTAVATVDQSGKVTAVGNGTAMITVSANDGSGKSASCTVTVTTLVTGITMNKTSLSINEGQTSTLSVSSVTPENASNKSVTWSSSNTSVATVNQSGVVTGVAKGTAIIKATAKDGSGKYASCSVCVGFTDLSVNGSSNCYIVSSAGDYGFRAIKGNSSISVGTISSAVVLWESYGTSATPSVGSIINNVSYNNNTIFFATPSTLNNGNAVIAAKDASGTILWSWHIWVCKDFDPAAKAQKYHNDAGMMMDRNLGATSATPGDVGALGLLYQWGRKDPFLSGRQVSYSSYNSSKAASTLTWPSPVNSTNSNGTISYAVKNPTTFIKCNSSNDDWYYTGSSSTDDTRWQSTKTIYDPCPPGWHVPDGGPDGVWSKARGSSNRFSASWRSENRGMNLRLDFGSDWYPSCVCDRDTVWYPDAGYLDKDDGILTTVGYYGYWWSCTPKGDNASYNIGINHYGDVWLSLGASHSFGYSVRCIQE